MFLNSSITWNNGECEVDRFRSERWIDDALEGDVCVSEGVGGSVLRTLANRSVNEAARSLVHRSVAGGTATSLRRLRSRRRTWSASWIPRSLMRALRIHPPGDAGVQEHQSTSRWSRNRTSRSSVKNSNPPSRISICNSGLPRHSTKSAGRRRFEAGFTYASALFDESTVETSARYLVRILGAVTESPHTPVGDMDLVVTPTR